MIDIQKALNKEQQKVVLQGDGPCLVLAGAGSGKTRTITYRVAYLLAHGVAPENILLVTFTNKAAREMIGRVEALTKGETRLPWSGTFHHIAYRILRQYVPLLGYQNTFTILDSEDSRDLLKLSLKQEGIDRKEKRFPSVKVLQSIISYAKNAETTIEDVLDMQHPKWLELADVIGRVADDYAKRKREANAMDFDDLLTNLYLLLLKSERTRKKFAEQFEYILVDEYQDTNKVQASIIRALGSIHKNVLVVGDDAQSIYSFRAADIENILRFDKQYKGASVFRLETNYRSTPEILDVANEVIANNRSQFEKSLLSVRDGFVRPEIHAFVDQGEEAEFIAKRILELRDEGVRLEKIAVLFRAAFHSHALEIELTKRDIPYEFRGGVRFFERAHIKDVLAYLRVYHNQHDIVAWSRVLNMQVGIGPATAQKIINAVRSYDSKDLAALHELKGMLSARAQVGWNDFLQVWNMLAEVQAGPGALVHTLLNSKYIEYLEFEHQDYRDRLQDIQQLALFAQKYDDEAKDPEQALNRFLAEASLQESYATAIAKGPHDDGEHIILSTIHQAKGLEWDAVFVLNVSAGQFPHDRALREANGIEEERRLFYVAITRAKTFLYFTYPLTSTMTQSLGGPSMFLEEIQKTLVDTHEANGGTTFFTDPSDDVEDIQYVAEDGWGKKKRSFLKSLDEL